MDSKAYTVSSNIGYNQVDKDGLVRSISTVQLFEEAAIEHCYEINRNVFDLLKEGYGWVLRSGSIGFQFYPCYGEKVKTTTWISRWSPFQGVREFLLTNEEEQICAKATSLWAYIDMEKRRPSLIPEVFRKEWYFDSRRAMDTIFVKHPIDIPPNSLQKSFHIRRQDIDSNNHVHNGKYLEWIMEIVPERFYTEKRIKTMEGAFLQEAGKTDQITVEVGIKNEHELVHNVIRIQDGAILATGRSEWL